MGHVQQQQQQHHQHDALMHPLMSSVPHSMSHDASAILRSIQNQQVNVQSATPVLNGLLSTQMVMQSQGNGQLPGTHPSNLFLGHSSSQSNHQTAAGVMVSNNLFASPM